MLPISRSVLRPLLPGAALMALVLAGSGLPTPAVAEEGKAPAASAPAQPAPAQATPASQPPAASAPASASTDSAPATKARPPLPPRSKARPADKALSAECVWTGERVVSLLARDDADMAERFVAFYDRFGCPMYRLGEAFSCVARSPVAQTTARAAEGASLADVAAACWVDPAQEFPAPAAEAPPAEGSAPAPQPQ
ncbi:hypothetical protein [Pararhodospirillum oryzae]|uniref:Beta-1-3, beta-1-6-glucan biosynthesis protein n=1 Tax=Pararhodospirillum oryzae TaxID=478448 RepID=A0A512H7H6_9PROT|nr:hypothetical protein [Pararhodospirillum oryzae]GEO81406.1 hypothetical protein ROR02_15370 [Pararhodospirillum oryzae]